ncbi:hypothetical protein YC2023_116311 [Brassica napus]
MGVDMLLLDAKDITEENKSYPCPTEWLFGVDIQAQYTLFLDHLEIPLRRKGIEFFWFDGKLDQKSEEKVLKDSMKPSQNSSASVSETWSRTKSNRIFTRLLNVTISLQPYVKILLDYGEMMAALGRAIDHMRINRVDIAATLFRDTLTNLGLGKITGTEEPNQNQTEIPETGTRTIPEGNVIMLPGVNPIALLIS